MSQGDVYKVTMVFNDTDIVKEYSAGFYVDQPNVTGFSVGDIGDAVKSWWEDDLGAGTQMRAYYAAGIKLAEVHLRKWNPLDPVDDVYTTGLPSAGTGGGETLPPESAVLVSLRTAKIGRSYRNRLYLPPIHEADVAEALSDATAQAFADQWAGLMDALLNIGATLGAARPVAYSRKLGTGDPVVLVKIDKFIRSQRRRNKRPAVYAGTATP